MNQTSAPATRATLLDLLGDAVPDDAAFQIDGRHYPRTVGTTLPRHAVVVDLGCGTGRSRSLFRGLGARWVGVDIGSSPAVDRRSDHPTDIVTFDGVHLPFADRSIDCVYSHQVLEHVRHPERLLGEVARVLKPGAPFIGSTSNLEPYHAYSLWNFTPYGFRTIVHDAGLELVEIRPGIDGPTLIERQVRGRPTALNKYFKETSPLNSRLLETGRFRKRPPARVLNARMLQFCGQFGFHARRPTGHAQPSAGT